MLVLPADHLIADTELFSEVVNVPYARGGQWVGDFWRCASAPETGYSYIEAEHYGQVSSVKTFHEKPELFKFTQYVNVGNYYWNNGMFIFTPETYVSELQRF